MYLAGVSMRRVESTTEILWGQKVSAGTISNLNQKCFAQLRNGAPQTYRKVSLRLCGWYFPEKMLGRFLENASVLVAIGVTEDGYREVIGKQKV